MKPFQDTYPIFEINQVLSNTHLNQLFDYLDEQERLTRANLIGIGIACGLEMSPASGAITLRKGCGVTSQGYAITEADEVTLVSYRQYTLPAEPDYASFKAADGAQYPLWELFPAGEPDTTPLTTPADFLRDKALLLFLELKKEGLRNCSANCCDDRGAQMTAALRRLLIGRGDLEKIIAAANGLASGLTSTDLVNALSAKLNLPDLRLPRYDVPSSSPASSAEVLKAFRDVIRGSQLAQKTGAALSALYQAFKPLVQELYAEDPFTTFGDSFGFLDTGLKNAPQVTFLQYYCEFFEILLLAYDEFRWKGLDFMCDCCPADLFPRHLMVGLVQPQGDDGGIFRQGFIASPASGRCGETAQELRMLFQRLVEMTATFTNAPPLPQGKTMGFDAQIRITPTRIGDAPLEKRAIPYYFRQDGAPPLYRIWNPQKARRGRENQNLSYRFDEYEPAAPDFVANPLRYTLEGKDFLRIEGHLGKNYQGVLTTLLALKRSLRLPIDVVALRTGAFDESFPLTVGDDDCRLQDLESLYTSLKYELICFLCKETKYFYALEATINSEVKTPVPPKLPLLVQCDPAFLVQPNTFGRFFEDWLARLPGGPGVFRRFDINMRFDVPGSTIGRAAVGQSNALFFIVYMSKLAEELTANLADFDYDTFAQTTSDLLQIVQDIETAREQSTGSIDGNADLLKWEELDDRLEDLIYNCRLEGFRALHQEFARRVRDIKQQQYLSYFLQNHPGIEHRGGVPLGGTFILVYHQPPKDSGISPGRFVTGAFGNVLSDLAVLSSRAGGNVLSSGNVISREREPEPAAAEPQGDAGTASGEAVASPAGAGTARETVLSKIGGGPILSRVGAGSASESVTSKLAESSRASAGSAFSPAAEAEISGALSILKSHALLTADPDLQSVVDRFTGRRPAAPLTGEEKVIADAISALSDGAVIADLYLPYLSSSDCPPVQFVLPKPPMGVTIKLDCTDPNGSAHATITPKGGVAPYSYQVDQQPYTELAGTVPLAVGVHTVTVRDSSGAQSDLQTVAVPAPLTLGAESYQDDLTAKTFRVTVPVSGGTPPYQPSSGTFGNGAWTSDAIASGQTLTLTITDSAGCSTSKTYSHTVSPPCVLPCQGAALRCGYRLWLPAPHPELQDQYLEYGTQVRSFAFEFPEGTMVDLTSEVGAIIQATPNDLNTKFDQVIQSWVDQINKVVAHKAGSEDWLRLAYSRSPQEVSGTITVERFACLKFQFVLQSFFQRSQGTQVNLQISYIPDGTRMNDPTGAAAVVIPAYNCVQINKCDPNRPQVDPCKNLNLQLRIVKTVTSAGVTLDVVSTGTDQPVAFLWEVQDAVPPLSTVKQSSFGFTRRVPPVKTVVLNAFTSKGCRLTVVDQVVLG